MPRFNVQHPETKQWRCFSSIIDDYVTDWMDEEDYEKWRKFEYGAANFSPVRECNLMTFEEAERISNSRKLLEMNKN
jgi:hypothetical protein